jgi:hypothetical protein
MQTVIIGGDFGNSETTVAVRTARGAHCLTFPSTIGSGDHDELLRVRSGAGRLSKLDADEFTLAHRGAGLFVGRLALEQSRDATTGRGNTARYSSGHTLRLLLTACGKLFKEDVTVRLITGLPVSVYSAEEKARVQQSLIGTHEFVFNGKPRRVMVDAVGLMMEGAAVLYDVAADRVPQCVIDVGGGSTDLFWAVGRTPSYERCDGYPAGVEKIGEQLVKKVLALSGGRRLTPDEVRGVLWAHATRQPLPQLYSRGRALHLNGEIGEAITAVGDELVTFVRQRWEDADGQVASSAAHARLVGGGAYYVRELFRRAIPHLTVPDAPERANALAYLAIGEAAKEEAWQRNRGAA